MAKSKLAVLLEIQVNTKNHKTSTTTKIKRKKTKKNNTNTTQIYINLILQNSNKLRSIEDLKTLLEKRASGFARIRQGTYSLSKPKCHEFLAKKMY